MPALNIFKEDPAFNVMSLLGLIQKLPHKPNRIGALNIFREEPITTTEAYIEEVSGQLTLIQTSERGGEGSQIGGEKRKIHSLRVPHLEREAKILAESIQNVRALGSESEAQAITPVVNSRLATLKAMHEVTLEHMRAGAIKGQVLDADGSVLLNLFTTFGVSQTAHAVDLTGDVRNEIVLARRLGEDVAGGATISGWLTLAGDNWFDSFIESTAVKESLKYQESAYLRDDLRGGFRYGGVTFENYRGSTGGTPFIPTDEAYMIPLGTDLFSTYFAPADFMETVNTPGLPMYAKIYNDEKLNRWAMVHSQSNPLCICKRPDAVVKLTLAT